MNELPAPETDDLREQDHGELFRTSSRQLPTVPMKPGNRKVVYGLLAAAAAVVVAVVALGR